MEKLARKLKGLYKERSPKDDADASPGDFAFRDFIDCFPVPVDVLLIRTEDADAGSSEGIWTLIRFDVLQPKINTAVYHGLVSMLELQERSELLRGRFGLHDLEMCSQTKPFAVIQRKGEFFGYFVPFNVTERLDELSKQLFRFFVGDFWPHIQARFRPRYIVDYNNKYSLEPDQILTAEELLQMHPLTGMFVRFDSGDPHTLKDWQEDVANILLIPKVPEGIQHTFRLAKRLYVFAFFEYGFFTISLHYAVLALEAALQSRWTATLPEKTPVEYFNGVKNELIRPTHKQLFLHWQAGKKKLRVNDRPFPHSTHELLKCLRQARLITKPESDRIADAMYERNTLSHVEFATVHSPSASPLWDTAELINGMFDRPNPEPAQ
jgi:hypothetical protein